MFLQKRHQRKSLAVTFGVLALFAAGGTWCYTSPKARAEIGALVPALRQTVDDVNMVGSITKKYDEQLEKIAVRGDQIAEATRAMGVDPGGVVSLGNAAPAGVHTITLRAVDNCGAPTDASFQLQVREPSLFEDGFEDP